MPKNELPKPEDILPMAQDFVDNPRRKSDLFNMALGYDEAWIRLELAWRGDFSAAFSSNDPKKCWCGKPGENGMCEAHAALKGETNEIPNQSGDHG